MSALRRPAQPQTPPRLTRLPTLCAKVIHISDPHPEERRRVEAFIEAVYDQAYGGRIDAHYPTLMSVQDAEGRIFAAVGFRFAEEGPLFLEQYLNYAAEAEIGRRAGQPVDRRRIVEIGNLASNGRGATVVLFLALAQHLRERGRQYAMATATAELRGIFNRAGFPTLDLAGADSERLADGGKSWGAYYEREPRVLAGDIEAAQSPLASFASATPHPCLKARLHYRTDGV